MALVSKTFSQIITFTRASTATYFDSAGVLQSAAIDAPRLDYNPSTLAAQGLLIEEQRSNIVYPSNFSSIGTVAASNAWYEINATLDTTVNAGVAPDGTTTAALLAVNAPSTFNGVFYRTTNTTAATYAFSCFCKAGSTDTTVRLLLGGEITVANNVRADFTLSGAGTASAATVTGTATAPSAPTIQAVNNGWYRCTIIVALTAPTNITGIIYPGNPSSQTTDSQTLVWGAQLEAGAFPTSYIPTTTTALTRSADVASVNTLSPWYNATEGTLFVEASPQVSNAAGFNLAELNDATASNRIGLFKLITSGNASLAVLVSGATQASTNSGAWSATGKLAGAYKLDDFGSSLNGSAAATDTLGTIPTVTQLTLGRRGDGANILNGYLRRITYYPRKLSSAELQAITA